jgi:hypothetical protein
MSDTPPTEIAPPKRIGLTTAVDNCPYDVGLEALEPMLNQNLTGFRPRGYGVGSLYQKWGEPELFYSINRYNSLQFDCLCIGSMQL